MTDLNTAPREALLALGLNAPDAAAILRWRPFSSWDAVLQVLDIDVDDLEAMKTRGAVLDQPNTWPRPRPFRISTSETHSS